MTRLLRRSDADDNEPEQESEPEEPGVEAVDDDADFQKLLALVEEIDEATFSAKFSLSDLLVDLLGPPGAPGVRNGRYAKLKEYAERLRDLGYPDYSEQHLISLRDTAAAFPALHRCRAEDAGISFTVLRELRNKPDLLEVLIKAQDGENPRQLRGKTTMFRGEEVRLATAIRRRGRITVDDAHVALGHQPASRSGGSSGAHHGKADGHDLAREEKIAIAKEVFDTDPEGAEEVVKEASTRSRARQAVDKAARKAAVPADPKLAEENTTVAGPVGNAAIVATMFEAKDKVDELAAEVSAFDGRPLDEGLAQTIVDVIQSFFACLAALNVAVKQGGMADDPALAEFMNRNWKEES
jgi:hypothetical protein